MQASFHLVRKSARFVLLVALLALVLASGMRSTAAAQIMTTNATAWQARPVEQMLNVDGTLNLNSGWSGTLDSRGWDVALDAERGPLFQPAGNSPAKPTAGSWSALDTGTNGGVSAIAISGSDVYLGGGFTSAGTCTSGCNYIAKWNGSTWSALGTGMAGTSLVNVTAIAASGSDVYAGGSFTSAGTCTSVDGCNNIAKWNTSTNTWSALTTGTNDHVGAIAISGINVYVGGGFWSAGGVADTAHIAKWNGSMWSALGTGTSIGTVNAIAASGSDVYAGGNFASAGTCMSADGCNNIAKWNTLTNTWSALSTGTPSEVYAIAVSSNDVYVGGAFTSAGGVANTRYIAKWNGSAWSALGTGMSNQVHALAVNGNDVYAGGYFTGVTQYIGKWNGSAWSALGTGTNLPVLTIAVSVSDVYAGGMFTSAGGVANTNHIAKYSSLANLYLPLVVR